VTKVRPIRILVAEDHLIARVGLVTIVNEQPDMIVVAEASNGQQSVTLYRQFRPDIVLMDERMPVMNGCDAAEAIRA
jgi:two-component system NarL family response regulator